jgi:hypothetical protein
VSRRPNPPPEAEFHPLPPPERTYEPIPTHLEYERFVEAPRRAGRDPVWEAMLAEALGPTAERRAS